MNNKTLISVAIAAAISSPVMAQSDTDSGAELGLDMIQVVGQATAGANNVITREQLENAQVNDLTDIFALNPEVSAGGAVAIAQKIYVRNVGEDMLNVTVDGAAQSGGVFHHAGRVVIEPDLIKQVEVEAGAGSATAGLGALGGAVRFVTKDPEDLLRGSEKVGATIKSTYYSNGESVKNSATVYGADSKGKFSGLANVVSAELNNREDGDGNEIVGSESENEVVFLKGVAQLTEQQKLSISYESLSQEGDMLYKPEWVEAVKNPISKTEANRETFIANYNFNVSELINLSVNAYQSEVEQLRGETAVVDGDAKTQGLTIENTSKLENMKLIYGVNYRKDQSSLSESGALAGKESSEVMGLYVQDIISVNDQLTVTTGFRFDDYSLTDLSDNKITSNGFAPNLSANYKVTPKLSVSAGYAESIRGATVADAYTVYAGEGYAGYINDPDLKEERSKNIEVAAEYESGPFNATIGAYDTTIEDPVGKSYPEIWSKTLTNGTDIHTKGYFLKGGYEQDGLSLMASYHSAETKQDGLPVTRYQQGSTAASIGDTLALDVNYQLDSAWTIGLSGQLVRDIDPATYHFTYNGAAEAPVTIEKDGYFTTDVYVRWSPMIDDTVVVNLTGKNLTDESYLNHASPEDLTATYAGIKGQLDPGRDVRLSVAYKF